MYFLSYQWWTISTNPSLVKWDGVLFTGSTGSHLKTPNFAMVMFGVWQGNTAGLGTFSTCEVKTRSPQLTHRTIMVSSPLLLSLCSIVCHREFHNKLLCDFGVYWLTVGQNLIFKLLPTSNSPISWSCALRKVQCSQIILKYLTLTTSAISNPKRLFAPMLSLAQTPSPHMYL